MDPETGYDVDELCGGCLDEEVDHDEWLEEKEDDYG